MVIPEGIVKIEARWFSESNIQSVTIPASVVVIEDEAFCRCSALERVIFAENSQLQVIGKNCFEASGLEEITLPGTLK